MAFNHGLRPGESIVNSQLTNIFKCSPQGGMRRSHKTNTLVIISDHIESIYDDRWINNIFHYTGMGQTGDQSLDFQQNKTLAQSDTNGIEVYLFEVFEPGKYTLIGQVKLAGTPYQERQPDKNGNPRNVWVFPLKLVEGAEPLALPEPLIIKKREQQEKNARKLTDKELEKRAKQSRGVGTRQTSATTYERNPYVAEFAKRRAKGICQLCDSPAPFKDKKGQPYLETHHIEWLSEGGEDSIKNTVALCPNCHRKMHALNIQADIEKLQRKASL